MDNTHYISTELLSLEILQEIVLHHKLLALSEEQKLIFKMS
jgi:histidine ammonia-lyase